MKFTDYIDRRQAEELRQAADLLYPPDDPRATPWPDPATGGEFHHLSLAPRAGGVHGAFLTYIDANKHPVPAATCAATR